MKSYLIKLLKQVGIISLTQGKHIQFSDILYLKAEIISSPLTCHQALSSQGTKLLVEGKKKKHWRKDGLPLLWASGLNCSARARIQTKAIKASASDTFPKQDCGTHFPSLEWDLHGDADITRLGKILSSACGEVFLTRAPSSNKIRDISAARSSLFEATPACVRHIKIFHRHLFSIF